METLFGLLFLIGPVATWTGLGLTLFHFFRMFSRGRTLWYALRYTVASVGLGILVYLPSALLGAWFFCKDSDANLCGSVGYVGTGGLVFGTCLIVRALRASKDTVPPD